MKEYAPYIAYLVALVVGISSLIIWPDSRELSVVVSYAMGATFAWFATVNHYRDKARREAIAAARAHWNDR